MIFAAQEGMNWLAAFGALGGIAGIAAMYRARPQNQLDQANRSKIMDDRQTKFLVDFQKSYDELAKRLDATIVELAQERAAGARKDTKILVLERKLEMVMNELAALRAEIGLGGRRKDDGPLQPH